MAITNITAGDGALIPDAYGEHIIAGHLIYNGGEPQTLAVVLGEGTWDSVVKLWYNSEPMTTDQYHFHPGTLSQSMTDPVQGLDSWLVGQSNPYSRTAYIVARPTGEELEPSKLVGRYKCRMVPDFDNTGTPTGSNYSSNPARILIALLTQEAKLPAERIDWASWYNWKVYCDTPIGWNDGTTDRQIKRFESHVAFTGPSSAVDILNMLTDMSASFWQDDGELVHFYPVESRSSVLTFGENDYIAGTFQHTPVDMRQQPTRIIINFRDLDNDFLAPASWIYKDEPGIDHRGIIDAGTFAFGAMHYSQAQRLAKYWFRRAAATERLSFSVTGEYMQLLPGDLVTVNFPSIFPNPILCHIQQIEDTGEGADNRRLTLAPWTATYADTDHEAIPKTVTVT
jgi:hypothetical protein